MDGVTAIANVLKLEGVDFIGCMPSNPLIEAAAIAGIRPIVFRQERTGVHMADGFSRITNGKRTGIFLMQAGPGAENAFGGVAQAYADSVPILLLPAGAARHRLGIDPVFSPTRSYESITKWAAQINYADRVPELMRHAFTKLRSGKPGPVLLEIPGDLITEEIGEEQFDYEPPQVLRTAGDPEAVARAARALLSAQRPVITAGQGVLYAEATDQLVELAEYLQIPVMTTLEGKSAFPENHPLSLGIGGSSQDGAGTPLPHRRRHRLCRGRQHDQEQLHRAPAAGQDADSRHQRGQRHQQGLQVPLPGGGRCEAGAGTVPRGDQAADRRDRPAPPTGN